MYNEIYCDIEFIIVKEYIKDTIKYLNELDKCISYLPQAEENMSNDYDDIIYDEFVDLNLLQYKYRRSYFFHK